MTPKVTYLSAKSPAIAPNSVALCSDMPQNAFEKPIHNPMMKGTDRIEVRTVLYRNPVATDAYSVSRKFRKRLSNQLALEGQL